MKRPLRLVLIAAFALCTGGCTHLLFQPSSRIYTDPADSGLRYEVIKFPSMDGTELTGMFFASTAPALGTIVHLHGNAQNMTSHFQYFSWLAREGFNVFIFDYRGYGASKGKPGLDEAVQDAVVALKQVRKIPGVDGGRIAVFGQSLGGAIGIAAIAESGLPQPQALVLEGTFYSYKSVASAVLRKHWWSWPFSWFPWLAMSGSHVPYKEIAGITSPKLFIHSETDPVVPFSQGKRLYDASPGPKELWTTPYGHIEAFSGQRKTYGPLLVAFLKAAFGPLPAPSPAPNIR
jgi:hypothetical protein